MNNPLVILFITYARTNYALRAIDSVFKNLITPNGFSWYICDDGSPPEHLTAVKERITAHGGHICGYHSERLGYGAGCNWGWQVASQTGPITLWLEDDWELEEPWEMAPYMDLLTADQSIGMVRMGHLPIGQSGQAISAGAKMYIKLDHKNSMYYSGNPHLKHDRFMLYYGPMPTGPNPGDTETQYSGHIQKKAKGGPGIVWPLYIGDRYLWGHIGTDPSYNKGGTA